MARKGVTPEGACAGVDPLQPPASPGGELSAFCASAPSALPASGCRLPPLDELPPPLVVPPVVAPPAVVPATGVPAPPDEPPVVERPPDPEDPPVAVDALVAVVPPDPVEPPPDPEDPAVAVDALVAREPPDPVEPPWLVLALVTDEPPAPVFPPIPVAPPWPPEPDPGGSLSVWAQPNETKSPMERAQCCNLGI